MACKHLYFSQGLLAWFTPQGVYYKNSIVLPCKELELNAMLDSKNLRKKIKGKKNERK